MTTDKLTSTNKQNEQPDINPIGPANYLNSNTQVSDEKGEAFLGRIRQNLSQTKDDVEQWWKSLG